MTATAFAAKDRSGILINTVSSTERAAKVNWLGTKGRQVVTINATDEDIARAFRAAQLRLPAGSLEIVRVEVREAA